MTIEERAERCLTRIAEIKQGGSTAEIEDMRAALAALGVTVRYAPVALWQKALVRHDPAALAAALRDLYREASPTRIYG